MPETTTPTTVPTNPSGAVTADPRLAFVKQMGKQHGLPGMILAALLMFAPMGYTAWTDHVVAVDTRLSALEASEAKKAIMMCNLLVHECLSIDSCTEQGFQLPEKCK